MKYSVNVGEIQLINGAIEFDCFLTGFLPALSADGRFGVSSYNSGFNCSFLKFYQFLPHIFDTLLLGT